MNIKELTHSQLMMGVELSYDETKAHRISRKWGEDIDKKHQGIVYFITVNDEIVKIGGSSSTIGKLVGQYLINMESKAEPRENRFCLHLRILSHLYRGDVVRYYYIPVQDMETRLEGMFGEMLTAHHREFRIVESRLIEQYQIRNGDVPAWNNTEGKIGWSEEIISLFDNREMRLKSGESEFFSYDDYIANCNIGLA